MIRNTFYRVLYRLMLPRGHKFKANPYLEREWKSHNCIIGGKELKYISCAKNSSEERQVAVLLAHPYLTEARYFFIRSGIARLYHKLGADVFITDFNGFGRSEFRDFNFEQDLIQAGNSIKMDNQYKKLILHGISFGAAQAVIACTNEDHPFNVLVVENCLDENISYFKVRNRILYQLMNIIHFFRPAYAAKHRYYHKISELVNLAEVHFIYGEKDTLTTTEMGKKLANNCKLQHQFYLLNSKHLESIKSDPEKYEAILKVVAQ